MTLAMVVMVMKRYEEERPFPASPEQIDKIIFKANIKIERKKM